MAYQVDEITKGNDSGSKQGTDGKITLTASRSFNIFADSDSRGNSSDLVRTQLQSAGTLPTANSAHPDNLSLICTSVKVNSVTPVHYTAVVGYESIPIEPSSEEGLYPWEQDATVNWRSVSSEVEVDEDIDGNAIVNNGTDEPITGVKRRVSDVMAIIKRPFLVFSGPVIRTFMDKTNTDAYLGFPAGEGLVQDIQADEDSYDETTFYNVTAQILFRTPYQTTSANAWKHRRVIKGFYELKNGNVIRAVDDLKRPVTSPVLLDASGERIDVGGTPEFQEIQVQDEIAYSGMGFFS